MIKVLVIADDFTGALDTGAQFAKKMIKTKVIGKYRNDAAGVTDAGTEVVVVNAETRHLGEDEAYKRVYTIVNDARYAQVGYLYKKTDSGLRGNIGKELQAAMDASAADYLTFVPAFPDMRRTTENGIHYIEGVPVSESAFGRDLSEPVRSSNTRDLFAHVDLPIKNYPVAAHYARGGGREIGIFDAATDADIEHIMDELGGRKCLGVMAGCAGFAQALAGRICGSGQYRPAADIPKKLFVICGSVNEITREEIEYAQQMGMNRITLRPEQVLDEDYLDTDAGAAFLRGLMCACDKEETCIVETGIAQTEETEAYRRAHGISREATRQRIALALGNILHAYFATGRDAIVMIIGGDTWAGCISKAGWPEISICREVEPGVILSSAQIEGKKRWLISKSGGFGTPDLLTKLQHRVEGGDI